MGVHMSGPWWKAVLAGLVLGGIWSGAADAAATFPIGQIHEGTLPLNGKMRAPLLPGRWEVIGASEHLSTVGVNGATYAGAVSNVVLAQIVGGKVKAAIVVSYNERSQSNGWHGHDSNCHRQDILHTLVQIDKQTVKLCDYVNHNVFTVGQKSAKWWIDSVNTLSQKGTHFPASWLQAGVWASTRSDFLYITYNFNPEFVGLPEDKARWEMSSWHKVRIADDPRRKAFADGIIA